MEAWPSKTYQTKHTWKRQNVTFFPLWDQRKYLRSPMRSLKEDSTRRIISLLNQVLLKVKVYCKSYCRGKYWRQESFTETRRRRQPSIWSKITELLEHNCHYPLPNGWYQTAKPKFKTQCLLPSPETKLSMHEYTGSHLSSFHPGWRRSETPYRSAPPDMTLKSPQKRITGATAYGCPQQPTTLQASQTVAGELTTPTT